MSDAGDVYRALAPAVLGYLRSQGAPDPDDLLGEVFLQVAKSLPKFKGDGNDLRRWVFVIARNRVIDDSRKRRRRPQIIDEPPLDQPAQPPAEPIDPELIAAVRQLTPDQREVVALRFIADLSLEQVAAMTKRTPGAVKSMQHRALEQLARILEAPSDADTVDG